MALKGLDAHLKRMKKLSSADAEKAIGQALMQGGKAIEAAAKQAAADRKPSASASASTNTSKRRAASAPDTFSGRKTGRHGSQINHDTLEEADSDMASDSENDSENDSEKDAGDTRIAIATTQSGSLKVEIASSSAYAAALEFGTSQTEARPFMKPAADQQREEVVGYVRAAIKRMIAQG